MMHIDLAKTSIHVRSKVTGKRPWYPTLLGNTAKVRLANYLAIFGFAEALEAFATTEYEREKRVYAIECLSPIINLVEAKTYRDLVDLAYLFATDEKQWHLYPGILDADIPGPEQCPVVSAIKVALFCTPTGAVRSTPGHVTSALRVLGRYAYDAEIHMIRSLEEIFATDVIYPHHQFWSTR